MIKYLLSLVAAVAFGFSSQAQTLPTFKTFTATNVGSTNIIIPQSTTSQIRIVSIIASSDLSSSTVSLYSGTTAHYVNTANASTAATTIVLESTNGVIAGSLLYVQGATSNVVATVSSVAGSTATISAALGIAQTVGMEVEVLSAPIPLGLGSKTYNVWASDGLFVGNYGRCVYATVTGTTFCRFDALTVHYDASSQ